MSSEEASDELNSLFESVVGVHSASEEKRALSYRDGVEAGRQSGYSQGFEFGLKMAAAYGAELGYSSRLAAHWKQRLADQTETPSSDRKAKAVQQLIDQCREAPRDNDPAVEFGKVVQKLQLKFKQVNSLVGDRRQYDGPNFLSAGHEATHKTDASASTSGGGCGAAGKSGFRLDF